MRIANNSRQGNCRIFQARQFQEIPDKDIRYKEIPDNFRQEMLGETFPSNSSQKNSSQFEARQFQARKLWAIPENTIRG